MVVTDENSVYVVGGFSEARFHVLRSLEKYNVWTRTCTTVGNLRFPVDSLASIADRNSIYSFGGRDANGYPVNCVQLYDVVSNTCVLLSQHLPRPSQFLRAVVWDRSVVLTSEHSCFLFDIDRRLWYLRDQYRAGNSHFGCTLENQCLFVFGGGNYVQDPETGVLSWILSDEIRYVPVADIVDNRPAQWTVMENHRLPTPSLVHAFAAVTAATGSR